MASIASIRRRAVRLGPFLLDFDRRRLSRGEESIPLRPRVFDTLVALVAHVGDVVAKEDLLDAVWPDTVVEENNLNQNILALRRVFGNGTQDDVRIETVSRRGYRLIAIVEEPIVASHEIAAPPARPPVPQPPETHVPESSAEPRRRHGGRWLALVAGVAAALLSAWIWRAGHSSRPIVGVRSIAVLPLRTLGRAPESDPLGLGLADAVITRLGYVRSLSVRPSAAVRTLPDPSGDPVAAGRLLRVDAVLDGQIQRLGDRIRVTVQLISVSEGTELWSQKFDAKSADLFSLEDSISESVASALTSSLSEGERERIGRNRETTPEAYEAYLQGRYFWNQRTASSAQRARELFERAISLDPGYAQAYAGLADSLNSLHAGAADSHRAREVAQKAVALDETLPEAYAALGNTSLFTDWNPNEAEKYFRKALDLNPSYAAAHQWYAYCFLIRGDIVGAWREIRRAHDTDPVSPSIGVDVSAMLYYAGRYDEAIGQLHSVLELDRDFGQARQLLPMVLLMKGEVDAAARQCSLALTETQETSNVCLALVAAFRRDPVQARSELSRIEHPEVWSTEAWVAAALGDTDAALAALERGYRLKSAAMLLIGAEPLYDGLRSDPRFVEMMKRVGVRPLERAPA